jgi:hypothetical protein
MDCSTEHTEITNKIISSILDFIVRVGGSLTRRARREKIYYCLTKDFFNAEFVRRGGSSTRKQRSFSAANPPMRTNKEKIILEMVHRAHREFTT